MVVHLHLIHDRNRVWMNASQLIIRSASAFQPLYGRIFQLFNIKWSYLAALGMFELGSLICGVAPNSLALIVGLDDTHSRKVEEEDGVVALILKYVQRLITYLLRIEEHPSALGERRSLRGFFLHEA